MRRRLRIVTLLDHPLAFGGAEVLARRVVTRLDPARFERTVFGTRPESAQLVASADEFAQAGVRFHSLGRRSRVDIRSWRPLVSLAAQDGIDILHAHKFGSNAWAAVLGTLTRIPVVIAHEHTWSFEGNAMRRLVDRHLIARSTTAMVAVSREDLRRMLTVERIPPERVRFIPNGIPPLPTGDGRRVRSELGIADDAPVVGSVSVLRAQKALDVLIDASQILARDFPDLRVLIAGHGPLRDALQELIHDRGLSDTVRLLGGRRDVPDLLAAFDVAVTSSDWEGTPLAVLEYMAAGTPVVATAVGGVPDLIEHRKHGLLVARRDPEELARAVAELLQRPALRKELGGNARDRQRREFDIDVTVRRIEDLYESLYDASPRGRREARAAGG